MPQWWRSSSSIPWRPDCIIVICEVCLARQMRQGVQPQILTVATLRDFWSSATLTCAERGENTKPRTGTSSSSCTEKAGFACGLRQRICEAACFFLYEAGDSSLVIPVAPGCEASDLVSSQALDLRSAQPGCRALVLFHYTTRHGGRGLMPRSGEM